MNLKPNSEITIGSPFDDAVKSDYAITIQIPPFKKVNYQGQYKAYKLFSAQAQKDFLKGLFELWVGFHLDTDFEADVFFEEHQDKRIHAHTYLKHITYDQIYNIQKSFCQNFGMREKQFQQVFNFFKPDNFAFWSAYCQKSVNDLDEDLKKLNNI